MADITVNNIAIYGVENRTQANIPLYTQVLFRPIETLTASWGQYTAYTQVEIVYVDNTNTERRRILPESELPRIRFANDDSGNPVWVQMRSSVFAQYLSEMSRMKQMIVSGVNNDTYFLNLYETRRIYLLNPTTVAFEAAGRYLNNRTITVTAQQQEVGEILIGITHNIPPDTYNLVIQDVEGITGKNPADFPFYFRELSENYVIEGDLVSGTDFKLKFTLGPVLTRFFGPQITATITGDPIIPQPEPPPIIPERNRYTLTNFRFRTGLPSVYCDIIAVPALTDDGLLNITMENSNNQNFSGRQSVVYTSVQTTGYRFQIDSNGTYFVRCKIQLDTGAAIFTPVYILKVVGRVITVITSADILGLLQKTRIFTPNIDETKATIRFENEIFLVDGLTNVKLRLTSGSQGINRTITNDGRYGFLETEVTGLTANTAYSVNLKATYNGLEVDVLDFDIKTSIAAGASPTPETEKAKAIDKIIKENLDIHEVGLIEHFDLAQKTTIAASIESNKTLVPDRDGGQDKNSRNKWNNRYTNKYDTDFTTETTLTLEDLLAALSETIPEPSEDNDLLVEPY